MIKSFTSTILCKVSLKLLLINHHCQKSLSKRVETSIPWHKTTKISDLCKRLSVSKTEITFVSGEALPHSAEGWPLQWPFQFFCGNTVDLTFIYLGNRHDKANTFPVKLFISLNYPTYTAQDREIFNSKIGLCWEATAAPFHLPGF